jgi:hypothetical protein
MKRCIFCIYWQISHLLSCHSFPEIWLFIWHPFPSAFIHLPRFSPENAFVFSFSTGCRIGWTVLSASYYLLDSLLPIWVASSLSPPLEPHCFSVIVLNVTWESWWHYEFNMYFSNLHNSIPFHSPARSALWLQEIILQGDCGSPLDLCSWFESQWTQSSHFPLFIYLFGKYWGLNSLLHACEAGPVPHLLWLFLWQGSLYAQAWPGTRSPYLYLLCSWDGRCTA